MKIDSQPLMENGQIVIDNLAGHVKRYNASGRVMMSAADAYHGDIDAETSKSMQHDFRSSWLILDTELEYIPDSLEAVITDHAYSTIITPNTQRIIVPILRNVDYDVVVAEQKGLSYVRTLFKADDDRPEQIKKRLQEIGGRNEIHLWTPERDNRKDYPKMAAGFNYNDDAFRVDGNYFYYVGCSRGVDQSSAAGGALKIYVPKEYEPKKPNSLALANPAAFVIQQMKKGESILSYHFRNGIGKAKVTIEELNEIDTIKTESEKADKNTHTQQVAQERIKFDAKLTLGDKVSRGYKIVVRRPVGDLLYHEPPLRYSGKTVAAQRILALGQELKVHADKLQQFPTHVVSLEKLTEELAREKSRLTAEEAKLQANIAAYTAEIPAVSELLEFLTSFSTFSAEVQGQKIQEVQETYHGKVAWEDIDTRSQMQTQAHTALFHLSQLKNNAESDLRTTRRLAESADRRKSALEKDVGRFWKAYNPVREAVVELSTTFREGYERLKSGEMLSSATELVESASSICHDVRRSMLNLEAEVAGLMGEKTEIYEIEQNSQRMLTSGEASMEEK